MLSTSPLRATGRRLMLFWLPAMLVVGLASCTHAPEPKTPEPPPTKSVIPVVHGTTLVEAKGLLHEAGLVLAGFREQSDRFVAKGKAITCDPTPGKKVDAGTAVVLVVSSGPARSADKPVAASAARKASPTRARPATVRSPTVRGISHRVSSRKRTHTASAEGRKAPPIRKVATSLRSESVAPAKPRPQYRCSKCGMPFDTQSELAGHMQMHVFKCRVCGASFSDVGELRRHAREEHFAASFKCPDCGASFHTSEGLRTHLATHGQ